MKKRNKQVIITGLPRTGTSIVAGLCHMLGVQMGDVDTRENPGIHPTGTYEDQEISDMNHKTVTLFPEYEYPGPYAVTDEKLIPVVGSVVANKSYALPLWGCKDPRISFMLDIWAKACDNPYFILTVRRKRDYLKAIQRYATNVVDHKAYVELVMRLYEEKRRLLHTMGVPYRVVYFKDMVTNPVPVAEKIARFLQVPMVSKHMVRSFVKYHG